MKRLMIVTAILLTMSVFAPTGVFAMVDAALFGGYTVRGDIEIVDSKFDKVSGYQFGIFAHLNVRADLFMAGLGFATQTGTFTYDVNGTEQEFEIKSSWGPDVILMINLGDTLKPYGRLGFSVVDRLEYDYGIEFKDKTRFLNSGWWVLGLGVQLAPSVMIFGEFQRFVTHLNEDHRLVRYSGNAGIMLVM